MDFSLAKHCSFTKFNKLPTVQYLAKKITHPHYYFDEKLIKFTWPKLCFAL